MSKAFGNMKKNRSTQFQKRVDKIEKGEDSKTDERFWKPTLDKAGNGYAVIRFLPTTQGDAALLGDEAMPYVMYFRHMFQVKNKWFVNNCPTTIGENCPVCESNSEHWAAGNEDLARKRKRQQKFVVNILVVSDPKNPDNDGKVFLYEFGVKIFEKIEAKMKAEFEEEKADLFDPFDFWEGANFKLKIRQVDKYSNYDKCEFEVQSELAANDKELEAIWESQHDLAPFIDPKAFKSFDELNKEFSRAVNGSKVEVDDTADSDGNDGGVEASAGAVQDNEVPDKDNTPLPAEQQEDVDYFNKILDEDS